MKPILIFRHVDCEGPGYFAEVLARREIPFQLIAVDEGQSIPPSIQDCSALVFMGGPMSVNDPLDWVAAELDLIRQAQRHGMPVLGHCLGAQLIAKALGASVYRNSVKEIGWHPVFHAENSSKHPWCRALPVRFEAFHWHGETFSLPVGADVIFSSQCCEHQAFVAHRMLGIQFHVEMTVDMVAEWARLYANELGGGIASIQTADQMQDGLQQRISDLHKVADVFYDYWLRLVVRRNT